MASKRRQTKSSILKPRKYSRAALAKRNRTLWFLGVTAALIICAAVVIYMGILNKRSPKKFSSQVKNYKPQIEQYCAEAGITGYEDYIMAIMQIESGGYGQDVMQSSESLGLARNTLNTDESIRQGCAYFGECKARADQLGCDVFCAVQAYNYGIDYVDFAAERGGVQEIAMAEEFAQIRSGGATVEYSNRIAKEYNGGYRYKYGNMFYAELIRQLLESENSRK